MQLPLDKTKLCNRINKETLRLLVMMMMRSKDLIMINLLTLDHLRLTMAQLVHLKENKIKSGLSSKEELKSNSIIKKQLML